MHVRVVTKMTALFYCKFLNSIARNPISFSSWDEWRNVEYIYIYMSNNWKSKNRHKYIESQG